MALSSTSGLLMKPISQHLFNGHLQSLSRIFGQAFLSRNGGTFILTTHNIGGNVEVILQSNDNTLPLVNDREASVVCAVLYSGNRKVCCSFFERWIVVGRKKAPEFKFDSAGLTFFLAVPVEGNIDSYKQIFRLEWDNWEDQDPPNKAAYPHWQFDRWLTGSTPEAKLEALRKSLESGGDEATAEPPAFETAEGAIASSALGPKPETRPNLGWFTRLHFPSIAPWATDPIKDEDIDLEEPDQPHRRIPKSPKQLEDWIRSSLVYLKNEVGTYD